MSKKTIEQLAIEFDAFERAQQEIASRATGRTVLEPALSTMSAPVEKPIADQIPATLPAPVEKAKPLVDIHEAETELLEPLTDKKLESMDTERTAKAGETSGVDKPEHDGTGGESSGERSKTTKRPWLRKAAGGLAVAAFAGAIGYSGLSALVGFQTSVEENGYIGAIKSPGKTGGEIKDGFGTIYSWGKDAATDVVYKITGYETSSQEKGN